jgi:hypothetical protein
MTLYLDGWTIQFPKMRMVKPSIIRKRVRTYWGCEMTVSPSSVKTGEKDGRDIEVFLSEREIRLLLKESGFESVTLAYDRFNAKERGLNGIWVGKKQGSSEYIEIAENDPFKLYQKVFSHWMMYLESRFPSGELIPSMKSICLAVQAQGGPSKVARFLDVSRATVHRWMCGSTTIPEDKWNHLNPG